METVRHDAFTPGETIVSPILLMGPSTTGKSAVAKMIARTIGAEIVNADRFYTYANDEFCVGLGLMPGELDDGIPRHLYGVRSPREQPLARDEYAEAAIGVIDGITSRSVPAVVEGCTLYYNAELYAHYGPQHCVRLSWQSRNDPPGRIDSRIRKAIDSGLYDETERNIEAGYALTFPMYSYLYTLAQEIGREPHNEQIYMNVQRAIWLRMVLAQDRWYENRTKAVRMDSTARDSRELAGRIINLMVERSTGT